VRQCSLSVEISINSRCKADLHATVKDDEPTNTSSGHRDSVAIDGLISVDS